MTQELPRIGRYEVITRLAIGGMAELFLARERGIAGLERLVVLKRILPHLADTPSFVDMFLREARIAARLAHPNVVQIFDLGEEDGSFFIAMEYIHGTTVRELQVLSRKHDKRFPRHVTIGILTQALRGLHAAHDLRDLDGKTLGLVHRDVSPHNIMCTTAGHVKLLDFGVAKATEEGLESTHSGNLKGKFAYMSPEQARRRELDRRSDIFAMGIVAWEMLTNERLFKRDAEVDMMKAVMDERVVPPSEYAPELPPSIDRVVMKALERDRERRWATAEAMRQELASAATDAGLDIAADAIAEWVDDVAGAHLELRQETLHHALERSLTSYEREGLLHVTGSESGSVDTEVDIPYALKMTRDAINESKERAGSGSHGPEAAATGETVVEPHRDRSESTEAPKKTPFPRVAGVVLIALVAAAAWLGYELVANDSEAEPDEPVLLGAPLKIAWSPTIDPVLLKAEIEPLRKYLERVTGRPITIDITESYGESSEKLLRGQAAFATLPPLMYVRTRAKNDAVEPIALKLFDGSANSDGLILVRGDTDLRALKDLEGKTFCFTDENSTTGHFLPRAYIRRNGYDLATFVGEIHWSGDHIQALRDLVAGTCDAAAVYSGAFISADKLGIQIGLLRQIAITGNVPQDPFVAGPSVGADEREAMRKALLDLDPMRDLGLERIGDTQRITAFQHVDDSHFDFLREVIAEAQVDSDAGTSE